jgi:hypothetical protein
MATYKHDCPRCGAKNSTFTVVSAVPHQAPYTWSVHMICGSCSNGGVANVYGNGTRQSPLNHPFELSLSDKNKTSFSVIDFYPEVKTHDVPQYLPESVAKKFREGCEIIEASPDAAVGMFRKALELGLKDLSPDIEAWKLEKRIDAMANKGLLTADLKDWAHELRLDGNDALHEAAEMTKEQAAETRELTRYVLTYLYTLPNAVKAMRGNKVP